MLTSEKDNDLFWLTEVFSVTWGVGKSPVVAQGAQFFGHEPESAFALGRLLTGGEAVRIVLPKPCWDRAYTM